MKLSEMKPVQQGAYPQNLRYRAAAPAADGYGPDLWRTDHCCAHCTAGDPVEYSVRGYDLSLRNWKPT